jgi:hypothetical protein
MPMQNERAWGLRPIAWAVLSFAGWVAAFALAFFVVAAAGILGLLGPDTGGLRVDLAAVLALHGSLAFGMVQVAAWLTLETYPRTTARRVALPTAGVALAVVLELALHEWAEARYGYYEVEFIGWTALLALVLVAAATSSFGVSVAPPGAAGPPFICLVTCVAAVLLIMGSNVRGLEDGVGPDGWLLAVLVGLAGAYGLGSVALGIRHLRSG